MRVLFGTISSITKYLWVCGFPSDNGSKLMSSRTADTSPIFGASVASLKFGRVTHAWIISTGNPSHITDPSMAIIGTGPVDGLPNFMFSSRGELQGLTVVTIMWSLLNSYHSTALPLRTTCDNKGVLKKCESMSFNSLRSHRTPNIDLYITQ